MRIAANEFVLPLKAGRSCHASNFTILPDGSVFVVYFCGSGEGHDDVRIFGSMRKKGEVADWSEPMPITPDDGLPHWNPVLLPLDDGTTVLFYKVGKRISSWQTYFCVSRDGCKTWSEPVEMIKGDVGGRGPVRNKCIVLSNKTILAPASTELDDWRVFFDLSTDNGKTWNRTDDIVLPNQCLNHRGIIQPTAWEDKNGVHALLRSSEGFVFRTDSEDFGQNWCTPYKTSLPNNNSGIDLTQTDDGRLILAYNPVCGNWAARTPLSLAISYDSGDTWEHLTHLVTENLPSGFSYPAIRYVNGMLHITYTWNRETIAYMCLAEV